MFAASCRPDVRLGRKVKWSGVDKGAISDIGFCSMRLGGRRPNEASYSSSTVHIALHAANSRATVHNLELSVYLICINQVRAVGRRRPSFNCLGRVSGDPGRLN